MNKKVLLSTVALGALVVAGAVAWNQYAKVKIREVVDSSFTRAESYFAAMNVQADFSYEDVSVSAFSLNPRASVHKVRLELSSPEGGGEVVSFLVPEVVYKPKNLTLSAYQMELLDAISVQVRHVSGESDYALIEFGANPRLVVDEERDGAVEYDLNVSDRVEYVPVDEHGNPAESDDHVALNFASAPDFKWGYNGQGLLTLKKISIPATVVEMAGEKFAQWTSLQGKVEYQYPDGAEISFYAVGEAQEFQLFTPQWQHINPMNTTYELSYTGADLANPESEAADGKVEVKSFSFVSPVVSLFSNGEFRFDLYESSLPVGTITVRLDQLDKFLPFVADLEGLGANFDAVAREYLGQIQGTPVEGDSVSFAISRADGERVYIGQLNLEEAIGSGLQAMFKLHQKNEASKGKIVAPVIPEEAEAPETVVDEKQPAEEAKPKPKAQPKAKEPEVKKEQAPAVKTEESLPVTIKETPLSAPVKDVPANTESVVIDTPSAEVEVKVIEKPEQEKTPAVEVPVE